MLSLDITNSLAKTITPSFGIPEHELSALQTTMKRYIEDWLSERKKGLHAWSMDPYDKKTIDAVKEAALAAKACRIRSVLWIGTGGAGLGPKALREVFEGPDTVEFHMLDSLDPAIFDLTMKLIDWKRTLIVIASKSGGTLEPMSLFFACFEKLKKVMKEKTSERVIAVTDANAGVLRSFCLKNNIRLLPITQGVGGRYSIFTPVGLLPVALLGGDLDSFIRGAREMDTVCQNTLIDENPAALLACVQFLLDTKKGYQIRVLMPYSQRLEQFAKWNQQLIGESLGKTETHNPIPVSAIGTQDQHSLLQQWMAGPRKFFHIFLREETKPLVQVPTEIEEQFSYIAGKSLGTLMDACLEGTALALAGAKRPSVTLTVSELNAKTLGALFFFFMTEAVLLGKLYRIDPYGQSAVEAGKKITKKILEEVNNEE